MTPDRSAGRLAAFISPACTGAGPGDRSSATPITDRVVGSLIMLTGVAQGGTPRWRRVCRPIRHYKWFAYANDFVIGFEHHRPTASRRSVRTVPAGANVVAVSVVAAAAVGPGRSGSDRSGAHRGRTDTVAAIAAVAAIGPTPIACAAHCDSAAAPRSSNCDSAAAVGSATAPIATTSATASIGVVGNEGN